MDELALVLAEAWALLAEGVADPGSPWRILSMANVTAAGWPGVRSVVLRAVLPEQPAAVVHTDRRSPKMAALARDPRAALLGWDAARRVQIRLDGVIEVAGEAATDAAWAALAETSRATYAGALAPGSMMAGHWAAQGVPDRSVFAVLRLGVVALDYVSLARGAHRRARFSWTAGGMAATWLAP